MRSNTWISIRQRSTLLGAPTSGQLGFHNFTIFHPVDSLVAPKPSIASATRYMNTVERDGSQGVVRCIIHPSIYNP